MDAGSPRNEYVQAFERGLAVISAFDGSPLTLSEVAERVGMSPAAARRYLSTLTELGYFDHHGGRFSAQAKLLELSNPFIAANDPTLQAQSVLEELTGRINETTTLTLLKGTEVLNVLDIQTTQELAIQVERGRLLPAHCTAMGRAMLSLLPGDGAAKLLAAARTEPRTQHTLTDPLQILKQVQLARTRGYAFVEEEHTMGIRTMAMAFRLPGGQLAAFSAPTPTARESRKDYIARVEVPLRDAVRAMTGLAAP
ncbi:MAG: IclR family transcriptional regulator C-terminal domain-containing protein [Paeniglutamicibacter sp.]